MNLTTLDLDTLRTLVTAHDLGGYGQAGVRLGRTASAISLQMKRLQADVGAGLFRKAGRGLALTEAGEKVLCYARRMLALNDELLDAVRGASVDGSVRLGCSQDFADTVLPAVLSQFITYYPRVRLEVRIEGNGALVEAIGTGELDMALVIGFDDHPKAQVLGQIELVWIAQGQFNPPTDQPLPLALLGPQCAFRKAAIHGLEQAGKPWRLAASSPSLTGLWACAGAGLGVTARSALNLPAGLISGKTLLGLPELGVFGVSLHIAEAAKTSAIVHRLQALISEAAAEALPPIRRPRLQKRS
jgi:DNA-binding transcriptional LysR family regulator